MRSLAEVSVLVHDVLWSGGDLVHGDSGTYKVKINPRSGSRSVRIMDPDLGTYEWVKQPTYDLQGRQRHNVFARLVTLGNHITWFVHNGQITGQGVVNGKFTESVHESCVEIVRAAKAQK